MFTVILDLAVINSKTKLEYNKKQLINCRVHLKNLATGLVIDHLKERFKIKSFKYSAKSAIETVLQYTNQKDNHNKESEREYEEPQEIKSAKCYMCIVELRGISDKE